MSALALLVIEWWKVSLILLGVFFFGIPLGIFLLGIVDKFLEYWAMKKDIEHFKRTKDN